MMKYSKIIASVCTVISVILIIVCVLFYVQMDRQKPEFKLVASDTIYRSEMDNSILLENISAVDNKDGDVTDRIVIEKIVESQKEKSVIVFYAVTDKAGNVAKISRVFSTELQETDKPKIQETTQSKENT